MKKFPSKYTKRLVTEPNHIAELMCERRFLKQNITLPFQFWSDSRYLRIYKAELRLAISLLKLYPIEIILKALNTQDGMKVHSLYARWLDGIIMQEKEKEENKQKVLSIQEQERQEKIHKFIYETLEDYKKIEGETPPKVTINHKGEVLLKKSLANKLGDL